MAKRIRYLGIVALFLLSISILTVPARAEVGFWWEGHVTESPWVENQKNYIGVNNVPFYVTPLATFYERIVDTNNMNQQVPVNLDRIRRGEKVLVKIQGTRIHQIIVLR